MGKHKEGHRFVALLKDLAQKKDLFTGRSIHLDIRKRGFLNNSAYLHLSSSLINMYVKCGALEEAHGVLEEICFPNEILWNVLVSGYAQQGLGQESINCFDRMQAEGLSPDVITFTSILKACGNIRSTQKGKEIHHMIMSRGLLQKDIVLGNALVNMYTKCLVFSTAQQVFEDLPVRDMITWNVLLVGHCQNGHAHTVLNLFEEMQFEGLCADGVTFICILKACGSIRAMEKGKQIHQKVLSLGLLVNDIVLGNALIDMYAKCGAPAKAQEVLDDLVIRDVISWNALISGYNQQGQCLEALDCFEQMQKEGVAPDVVTYICIMKSCGDVRALEEGRHIHDMLQSSGLLETHTELSTGLVCMYVKCGALALAKEVLEGLPVRTVGSWSSLIAGYVQLGQTKEALNCFERMQNEGFSPDAVTFIYTLKACSSTGDINKGQKIHDEIVSRRLLEKDIMLGSALVDMYAKCGALTQAQEVLSELPMQDVVCWNALITGYADQGKCNEAINCYERMQNEGLSPNAVTFICMLKVCGAVRAVEEGAQIHEDIMSLSAGLLETDIVLGNTLVDMYAKCGLLAKAEEVFVSLPMHDIISWNVLMTGYVHWGEGHKVLLCYQQMQAECIFPDAVTFICILKACGSTINIEEGLNAHKDVVKLGFLEKDISIGNSLVDMYVKFCMLKKAKNVLEELPFRDVVTWNSLISGYAQQGRLAEALKYVEMMQAEGFLTDEVTYVGILKACGSVGDMNTGEQIHEEIVNRGLLKQHVMLGNALADMYVKCCDLAKAQEVLDELPARDLAAWSALIAGYVQQEQGEEALYSFERMQNEGVYPDVGILDSILKACGSIRALHKGKRIHNVVTSRGLLEKDILLGSTLVDMYSKCGMLAKAEELLGELLIQDVVAWNMLIAGYARKERCQEAFSLFGQMQNEGLLSNAVTYILLLKACNTVTGDLEKGKEIHSRIISMGLMREDIVVGNALVDMYAKCGALGKAQEVLEQLPVQDVVSWNALIAGCSKHEQAYRALGALRQMQRNGIPPDPITLLCILKACGSIGAIDEGERIHDEILNKGWLKGGAAFLGNALVDMYAKCGMLGKAKDVFDDLPARDIVSWNALLTGYAQRGRCEEALGCFAELKRAGLAPDTVSFACVLKACGSSGAVETGKEIHDEVIRRRLLENDAVLGNSVIAMYAKCGVLAQAEEVLKQLPRRDAASWSVVIAGYAFRERHREAWRCFEAMKAEGFLPNAVALISILRASCSSSSSSSVEEGFGEIARAHSEIACAGFLEKDARLANALVGVYAKRGMLERAHGMLRELPRRDAASWNALISGYAEERGQERKALECFESMRSEGLSPNSITFVCALKACGRGGFVEEGRRIHGEIASRGLLLEKDPMLGNALVDMYTRCGMLVRAQEVLEELPLRDAISWNVLISGYSHAGRYRQALDCFQRMQAEGVSPDPITFIALMGACSHSGLLDEARLLFGCMSEDHGIAPDAWHQTGMVVALGHAGRFDEAMSLILAMPSSDYVAVWLALLGSCRRWGNAKLGRLAFDRIVELDRSCGVAYALMASVLASAGMLEDAKKVESLRFEHCQKVRRRRWNLCDSSTARRCEDGGGIFAIRALPEGAKTAVESLRFEQFL